MIKIHSPATALIGDALSTVPWMKYLCDQHGTKAVITGDFNPLVAELLGPSYPFVYDSADCGEFDAEYTASVAALFGYCSQCHMCQCFFKDAGKPLPELPLEMDLRSRPSGLPPGVVISPYCRSNSSNNNKFWAHDRWLSVIGSLRSGGLIDRVYVLGASNADDPTPYIEAGVEPVFDRPLAEVLNLLRQAPLVLTVDNGISHLAHYGGVQNHVLLYPGCLPECWVPDPRAVIVRAPMPIDIQPYSILQAARTVLGRP